MMVDEQILKRLQDMLRTTVLVLEQLEQLQWLTKDIIEDLELELHPIDASKTSKTVEDPKTDVSIN